MRRTFALAMAVSLFGGMCERGSAIPSGQRNVMKSSVLWDEVITALRAREYPDVELLQSQTMPKDRNPIRQNRSEVQRHDQPRRHSHRIEMNANRP
jgi:hypothetical protein